MKNKVLLSLIFLFYISTCLGQDLKFKDILIKEPLSGLIQNTKEEYPADIQYQDKNGIFSSVTFLDKPVLYYIIHFSEKEQIKSIDIKFPLCYNWESLEGNYN